jgi:hypothetical protein
MAFAAKFSGSCSDCGGVISVGMTIETGLGRLGGKYKHSPSCPKQSGSKQAAAPLLAGGPAQRTGKSNRRGGGCERCGTYLEAGKGDLFYCVEDSGCLAHHDRSGYHLYCADKAACDVAREENKRAAVERANKATAERKAARELEEAENASFAQLTEGLTRVSEGRWPLDGATRETLLHRGGSRHVRREKVTLSTGDVVYRETISFGDDHREYLYCSRELAEFIWREWLEMNELSSERAREWLAKYRGCEGTAAYEFVAAQGGAA